VRAHRHYSPAEQARLRETVLQAQARSGCSLRQALSELGVSAATFYRWQQAPLTAEKAEALQSCYRTQPVSTPAEVQAVCAYARTHPGLGYKRLCWQMLDADLVALRPWQVHRILQEADLLARKPLPTATALHRPAPPERADQVWHVDLMYLRLSGRWYYLVDILDGYSRFLVHWTLNPTMRADTVTRTLQEALDSLPTRVPSQPQVVHDHGAQFLSAEWFELVKGADLTNIVTRIAHPQSNGRVERLHRTHRQEGLAELVEADYFGALDRMSQWSHYYNYVRAHSALRYLCPADYYRGDPAARLAEREAKLRDAQRQRQAYWATIARPQGG
jgi:putative transposase